MSVFEPWPMLVYGLAWCSFGLLHSVFAAFSVKAHTEKIFGRANRLIYNVFACVHLALVFYGGSLLLDANVLGVFANNPAMTMMRVIRGLGMLFILYSLSRYDLGEFIGVKQFDENKDDDVSLNTNGINGWIRHPMYLGVLLFVWGGASSQLGFYTAAYVTGYLLIGIRFEEKKLERVFGDAYNDYQRQVSMLFPIKKFLGK